MAVPSVTERNVTETQINLTVSEKNTDTPVVSANPASTGVVGNGTSSVSSAAPETPKANAQADAAPKKSIGEKIKSALSWIFNKIFCCFTKKEAPKTNDQAGTTTVTDKKVTTEEIILEKKDANGNIIVEEQEKQTEVTEKKVELTNTGKETAGTENSEKTDSTAAEEGK